MPGGGAGGAGVGAGGDCARSGPGSAAGSAAVICCSPAMFFLLLLCWIFGLNSECIFNGLSGIMLLSINSVKVGNNSTGTALFFVETAARARFIFPVM